MKTWHPSQNLFSPNPEINVSKGPTILSTNELEYVILHSEFTLFSSVTQSCLTLCSLVNCRIPGFPVLYYLLEFAQTYVHWVSDAIQPSHPLSSPSALPSIFPSIRVFSSESVLCIRWPEYWSFSFSISPSNEYSELISFIDWFDLLPVQRTLESLMQHHSSKASIPWGSAFFTVQLSHPYIRGKIYMMSGLPY